MNARIDESALKTIFHECRQCGTCCKKYRKITLLPEEVADIERLGGYVGVDVSMKNIREKGLQEATTEAREKGKVYMIHPDGKGCIFLERRNDKYYCKIYHYRPRACSGFRCTMADESFLNLFADDAACLLG